MKGSDLFTVSVDEDAGEATVKLTAYGKRAMKYDGLWFADVMRDVSNQCETLAAEGFANFTIALTKRRESQSTT